MANLAQTRMDPINDAANSAWRINVFGVRHLSPAAAWHLRAYLDRIKPTHVLIECMADATELIPHYTHKGTKPPFALLAYTDSLPVRTLVYPMARYSPEYQAVVWAKQNKAEVDFIDLPSDVFLALQDREAELASQGRERVESNDDADPGAPSPSVFDQYAQHSGEKDYESYWERHFEHNLSADAYRLAAFEFGAAVRELEHSTPRWRAENLVREAFMRRKIAATIATGVDPNKIVAVVGAFHAPVLTGEFPAMSDQEFKTLRRRACKFTLMPYSYFKLSSQSGYGAGNKAPSYFEMMFDSMCEGTLTQLPAKYLTSVVRHLRQSGTHRSTAELIEAVRLANTLAAMKEGLAPVLADLHDAAITLIGQGELSLVKDALMRTDVGTDIGALPDGVSRTSIQADFEREILRLKLEKYKTNVRQELSLDLRENRSAKSDEAAFLDLNRSSFCHRLRVLGVQFVAPLRVTQQSASWAEKWMVQWSPESEIQLIEAVLMGETVELATAFKFTQRLEACSTIAETAAVVHDACQCGMVLAMDAARARLQELAALSHDFPAITHAAHLLGLILRYGDVRRFDVSPLLPLVETLFVQATLALDAAANCDAESLPTMLTAINQQNQLALDFSDRLDEALWLDKLRALSDADDRNPVLSGFACAVLIERGLLSNEELSREVSRRLSPGVPADLGAGWFEGLSKRNRYALLARQLLWTQLADYIAALDEEHFRRAVVFLRRAFGAFNGNEKRHIAENLAEHWGVHAEQAAEALEASLSEQEEEKLKEINDFNFDDF